MKTFESEMLRAKTMAAVDDARSDYWAGYQRGLRRAHHGKSFGTQAEHALWLSLAEDTDPARAQRGDGYRDGINGLRPPVAAYLASIGSKGGKSTSEAKRAASRANGKRPKKKKLDTA